MGSLWELYRLKVPLKAKEQVFRDHIIMYAESAANATETVKHPGLYIRRWLRYLRLLMLYLAEIKQQFTAARHALVVGWRLGMHTFLHSEGQDYVIKLAPPFLNYCY